MVRGIILRPRSCAGEEAIAAERVRGKESTATENRPGIINCRDDLITRLNELPAIASRHDVDTFSIFGIRREEEGREEEPAEEQEEKEEEEEEGEKLPVGKNSTYYR